MSIDIFPGVVLTLSSVPLPEVPNAPRPILGIGLITDRWVCDNLDCDFLSHKGVGIDVILLKVVLGIFISWGALS